MIEEPFPGAEQDRDDRDIHLVDEAGSQILLDRGRATAQPDVAAAGCVECLLERYLDARGWDVQWPTVVMTARPAHATTPPMRLAIDDHASPAWLAGPVGFARPVGPAPMQITS